MAKISLHEGLAHLISNSYQGKRRALIRRLLKFALVASDFMLVALTLPLALIIRHDFALPFYYREILGVYLALSLAGYGIAFTWFRVYNTVFRLANISTALRMCGCIMGGALLFYLLASFSAISVPIPRSIYLIQMLLLMPSSLIMRFSIRIAEGILHRFKTGVPTLIYGAGRAATSILPTLMAPRSTVKIVGLLDDDPHKVGSVMLGLKVLGTGKSLEALIARHGIKQVIIAMPQFMGKDLRDLLDKVEGRDLKIKVFADINHQLLQAGRVWAGEMRDISIQDLLRRAPRTPDAVKVGAMIRGSKVLVTGGGGSIGSELCRQILSMEPEVLVINDACEFNLYKISEELNSLESKTTIVSHLGNIADAPTCRHLFAKNPLDIVFHACAFKHVPLVEGNPLAAISNNIKSAWHVFEEAKRHKVKHAVLISSDKAVLPTNVMGATKRVCELAVLWFAQNDQAVTAFSAVRFGNVLGSSGSVVPKFTAQIEAGGPVTITHPDVTRYFMLIPEAVSLVLQAATSSQGGELLVLNMGEQVRIYDLAVNLIKLKGFLPHKDVPISYVGLRPGEKLYEELQLDSEDLEVVSEDIFRVRSRLKVEINFPYELTQLLAYAEKGQEEEAKALLFSLIKKYESSQMVEETPQRLTASGLPASTGSSRLVQSNEAAP